MKLCLFLPAAVLAIIPSSTFAIPGALDTTFGGGYFTTGIGQATTISPYTQMAIQPNGKIVIAANTGGPSDVHISLYRYNANASVDTTFGTGGAFTLPQDQVAYGNWFGTNMMTLQPDGKIVVVASRGPGCVVSRINSNGSMDNSFGGTGSITTTIVDGCYPTTVRTQSDGKILVAGIALQRNGSFYDGAWFLARYNSDGTPDTGYGTGGIAKTPFAFHQYGEVLKIFIQPDGKYLLCGNYGFVWRYAAARFTASGGLDTSFAGTGVAVIALTGVQEKAMDVVMQPDGKIIFAGDVGTNTTDFSMGRMNADGSLDTTFGSGGWVTVFNDPNFSTFHAAALSLMDNGKILAGGYILTAQNSRSDFAVMRYNANGTLDSARLPATGRSLKSKTGGLPLVQTESVLSNGLWGNGGLATAGAFNGNERITSMAVDGVGRVVTAGHSAVPLIGGGEDSEVAMARFLDDAAPLANIYGTIRTAGGMPIKNVSVVLSEGGLSHPVYALTNQFGLYTFGNLQVTERYSVSVNSKRFSFVVDQKFITLLHDEESVDFTAEP